MEKIPTYLGIFFKDPKANKTLKSYTKQALTDLAQIDDDKQIMQDLGNFDQIFQQPKDDFHITTLFIGGNAKKMKGVEAQQFKDFKSKLEVEIVVDCIVYIPGYIICAYCSQTNGIQVNNKFPHITLYLTNGAKAVESNAAIQAIYKNSPEIFNKKQFKTGSYPIQMGKYQKAYIIANSIKLTGITGDNFMFGRKK